MTQRVAYAWQEQDKFFLSAVPYNANKRHPANWYDTQTELVTEASHRKMKVEWAKTGLETPNV